MWENLVEHSTALTAAMSESPSSTVKAGSPAAVLSAFMKAMTSSGLLASDLTGAINIAPIIIAINNVKTFFIKYPPFKRKRR
jgi:hypothetical protein